MQIGEPSIEHRIIETECTECGGSGVLFRGDMCHWCNGTGLLLKLTEFKSHLERMHDYS